MHYVGIANFGTEQIRIRDYDHLDTYLFGTEQIRIRDYDHLDTYLYYTGPFNR